MQFELNLLSDMGYSVAVYVQGIDEGKNELLESNLQLAFYYTPASATATTLVAMLAVTFMTYAF